MSESGSEQYTPFSDAESGNNDTESVIRQRENDIMTSISNYDSVYLKQDKATKDEEEILSYFNDHNIFPNLDQIMRNVLDVRPDDPEKFILTQLRLWDARESGNDEMTKVLVSTHQASSPSPTTTGNTFFNPQLQALEREEQKRQKAETAALEYEKNRALEQYETENYDEGKNERATISDETSELSKLLLHFSKSPDSITSSIMETIIEKGGADMDDGMLSLRLLRFMISMGLTNDEHQLTKPSLKLFRLYSSSANFIPLNHPLRLSYEGPIHLKEVHAFQHRIVSHVLPVQAPSICYQATHKLFLEYAVAQGRSLSSRGIRELDSFMSAEVSSNVRMKGIHVTYQFRVLMRLCHTWLTIFTEPMKEWSRLLHIAMYTLVGYDGQYLHSSLIKDLGNILEDTILTELQSAVQKEKLVLTPCQLCAQVCFRWLVRETALILDDISIANRSVFEEGCLENMTVSRFLKSVLDGTKKRPSRLESISLYQGKEKKPFDNSVIPLNFRSIDDSQIRGKLLTCRGCLAQLAESSELLDIYQKFETSGMSDVAEKLDILGFGERDDLAVLLSIGIRCLQNHSDPNRINHMTRVTTLDANGVDNLYLRSRLITAFVDAMLLLQYRSTLRVLESGVIEKNFTAPSLPPIMMKCMVPQEHRLTLLEVLLCRFKFCTVESLSSFFGVMTSVMMGQGGLQRSIFEASVVGIIFANYTELMQIMNRYLSEIETTAVLLVFTAWNRLIRNTIFSVISFCIYSRIQSFSESMKQKAVMAQANSANVLTSLGFPCGGSFSTLTKGVSESNMAPEVEADHGGPSAYTSPKETFCSDEPFNFADALVERELFALLRRRVDDNCDTGIFMDSIQNPITRERLTGQERCFMVRHWDYVKLGVQFRNSNLWFNEFSSKVNIMVQHDISPDEIIKMATVPLVYVKDVIETIEKQEDNPAVQSEKASVYTGTGGGNESMASGKAGGSSNGRSHSPWNADSPSGIHSIEKEDSKGTGKGSAVQNTKHEDPAAQKEVFDLVVCSHASFSHLLGTFLYEVHTSGVSAFIFNETSARWNCLRVEDRLSIIANSLPRDINFSSAVHEQARRDIEPCLSKFFSGEISRENLGTLVVVLFNCGVIPCRHFDFFNTVQKLIYRRLDTPNTAPYFTHLAHRLLKYPLFHIDRRIDMNRHKTDRMLDAWEEFLRDPSSVFEATRAILDLIPREIMLENDVAMLRDKLRVMPQKYIQIFSSRAKEKDIITIAIWFRLHTGIPRFFMEAIGVTLFDVFISSYDAPYTPNDATKLIQRIDRAYRIMLTSTQPKMEELERMLKVVSAAVAPQYSRKVAELSRNIDKYENPNKKMFNYNRDDTDLLKRRGSLDVGGKGGRRGDMSGNERGNLSLTIQNFMYNDFAVDDLDLDLNLLVTTTKDGSALIAEGTPKQTKPERPVVNYRMQATYMKLFDRLMHHDVILDVNAWRCHALSVHLVYAITHGRSFADGFYAEATLKYLTDLCFLLRYVSVDSYLRYFSQFFVRLLVAGLTPKLVRDICDRFFETLHALNIPFDTRMPTVLSIVLSTQLERSHDEVEQSEFILEKVKMEKDSDIFRELCSTFFVHIPISRVICYRIFYLMIDENKTPTGEEEKGRRRSSGLNPTDDAKTSTLNLGGMVENKSPEEVVSLVQKMMKSVVDEIFLLLNQLTIAILENSEDPSKTTKEMEKVMHETIPMRAFHMIALLSAGSAKAGLQFIMMYGEYIQQKHLQQQLVGPGPVSVWSRVVGTLTEFMSTKLDDCFVYLESYNESSRVFPRDFSSLKVNEVLDTLEQFVRCLNPSGTTDGMYLCGSAKRYFGEIAGIIYAFFLESRSERVNMSQMCRRLAMKMEGTTDDIVVALCCLLPGLMKATDNLSGPSSNRLRQVDGEGYPELLKVLFSLVQKVIVAFEKYLRDNFELYLEDRDAACKSLTDALTAQHPPIAYEDGAPISMNMLIPSQILMVKQGLINTMLNCVQSIYVMDAKAAAQIEQRHVSSAITAELEKRGIVQSISAEATFMHSFSDQNARRSSVKYDGNTLDVKSNSHRFRVLSFSLYNEMLITDNVVDALFTSGLMTADVLRFAHIFDDNIMAVSAEASIPPLPAHHSQGRRSSISNIMMDPSHAQPAEQGGIRQLWLNLLCLVSQNLRVSITHSKISLSKELGPKTVKAFFKVQSLVYIDLLRQTENEREFVEWMGAEMPCYPYLEEWLLPALLRAACLVEDKMVVNATKKMRNDTRDLAKQQQELKLQKELAAKEAARMKAASNGQMTDDTEVEKTEVASPLVQSAGSPLVDGKEKKKASSVASSQQTAQRAVVTQRLPLLVLQNVLLDILHPKCQFSIISVIETVGKNVSGGHELKRHLSRAFFYQLCHQRLVHLTRRWCLADQECNELSDLWKRFRAQDRAPVDPTFPQPSPNNAPPSQLARELSNLMGEPLEQMESLVLTLDHLLITHLKSIFRWNTPAASLLAMFIYTDSVEFHRAIYYLHSRWCVVAITICNCLQAMGGVSEGQFIAMVRVLRSIRVMRFVVERLAVPENIMLFLQSVPYNILLSLTDTNDIQQRAITAAPATVNMTVVENSLQNLVERTRELLLGLRAIFERLQAGRLSGAVTVRPTDLLHIFIDWANIHSSQGKDATRASFRGLALLISTSVNDLSAAEARAIFERSDKKPPRIESPFTECGGLGHSIAADQLRMIYTFSMVCCNGLRDLVKDERMISTSFLPDYVLKEIRVVLPEVDDVGLGVKRLDSDSDNDSDNEDDTKNNLSITGPTAISRVFSETIIIGAIGRIIESGPVTFTDTRNARLAETELRDALLKIFEVVMDFVINGVKREYSTVNALFAAKYDYIMSSISPDVVCFEEICGVCFFLLQEIRIRGRLQLSPSVLRWCDLLITSFCRSMYNVYCNSCGERHAYLRKMERIGTMNVSSSVAAVVVEKSMSESNLVGTTGNVVNPVLGAMLFGAKPVPPSLFIRAQFKMTSGQDMATVENVIAKWEVLNRHQLANDFPVADIKIYCYMWVSLLGELVGIYIETLPMYLRTFSEMTRHQSSPEEFRAFLVFLHRVAFHCVAEQWITEQMIDIRIREWFSVVESGSRAIEVASCAVHSLGASLAKRLIRSDKNSSLRLGATVANTGSKKLEKEESTEKRMFQFFNGVRLAWSYAMNYFLRRIAYLRKDGQQQEGNLAQFFQNPLLNGPSPANQEVIKEASVAESSLLASYINKHKKEINNDTSSLYETNESTFSSLNNFLQSPLSVQKPSDSREKSAEESKKKRNDEKKASHRDKKDAATKESTGRMEKMNSREGDNGSPQATDGFIDRKELASAHTPECTWTVINGVVYDITRFVMMHPGGSDMMIQYCAGQDCTERFVQTHLGNERVLKQLEDMRIGVIKE